MADSGDMQAWRASEPSHFARSGDRELHLLKRTTVILEVVRVTSGTQPTLSGKRVQEKSEILKAGTAGSELGGGEEGYLSTNHKAKQV